jgi:hypothetical protein
MRVGKGALRAVPTILAVLLKVGTRSLSSGAHSRDPLALPTLGICDYFTLHGVVFEILHLGNQTA